MSIFAQTGPWMIAGMVALLAVLAVYFVRRGIIGRLSEASETVRAREALHEAILNSVTEGVVHAL